MRFLINVPSCLRSFQDTAVMDLEVIILSQTKTNMWYHLYVESKRNDTSERIYKTEIDSDIENKLMVIEGERMVGGVGINTHNYI